MASKKKAGKRTGAIGKYDKERANRIIEIIRGGNFFKVAYGAVGISKDCFFRWLKEHPDFNDLVKKARHEAEARNVSIINQAATRTWQAAAWYLERKHPERWASRQKIEHSGRIESEAPQYSPDEALMILEAERKRLARQNGKKAG